MATRITILSKDVFENNVMETDRKIFKVKGRTPVLLKAREVKDLLVSEAWWDQLNYFLDFTPRM